LGEPYINILFPQLGAKEAGGEREGVVRSVALGSSSKLISTMFTPRRRLYSDGLLPQS
jgi:hypothetical protein